MAASCQSREMDFYTVIPIPLHCHHIPKLNSAGMLLMYSSAHPHHFYGIVQIAKPINPLRLKTFPPLTRTNQQKVIHALHIHSFTQVMQLHLYALISGLSWKYYALLHALFLSFLFFTKIYYILFMLQQKLEWGCTQMVWWCW